RPTPDGTSTAPPDATVPPDAGGEDVLAPDDGSIEACAPWTGFPGCGGGQNFCVTPDASVASIADGGGFGAECAKFCGAPASYSCSLVEAGGKELVRCRVPCTGRRPAG